MNGEYISLDTAKKLKNKERVINILLSRIAKLEYEVERLEKIEKENKELNNIIHQIHDYLELLIEGSDKE